MNNQICVLPGARPGDGTGLPRIFGTVGDAAAFLIPCLICVELVFIGRLFLAEFFLLGALPILLLQRGRALLAPLPRMFILLGLLWLLSQIATDVIRSTPFVDWARGWAKIIFLLINFAAIYLLLGGSRRRLVLFAAGVSIGQILAFYVRPSENALYDPWKFGFGFSITLLIVLCVQSTWARRMALLPEIILAVLASVNLYLGFRSLAAICFLTGAYLIVQRSMFSRAPVAKISKAKMILLAGALCASALVAGELYGYAARAGWLGEVAFKKYEAQSSGDLGVILGGRQEIFASSQAILDSPLIGHGSWAKDRKYVDILLERLTRFDYETLSSIADDLIPAHSFLFGSWVEAGLLGAVVWMWVMVLAATVLARQFEARDPLTLLIVFVGLNLVWSILFSPLGAEERIYAAYFICFLMYARASLPEQHGQGVNRVG